MMATLIYFVVLIFTYICLGFHRFVYSFDTEDAVSLIRTSFECHSNPGMAVAVVKNGQVLLSQGFGVIDLDTNTNVTANTLFGLASVTKSFAATLMVKLLNEKTNLTVNSKVLELLGDKFQMPDEFRTKETTFADLLSHRTAVPPHNRIRYDNNLTRENLIERFPMLVSPHPFRVDFFYSSLLYGFISRLSEIIGDDRWENLIQKHIFKPLGMDRSTFATRLNFEQEDNLATPYFEIDGPKIFQRVLPEFSRRWAEMIGSGSIFSTSNDMAKWMNFHLNGGRNEQGQQIMAREAFSELHTPRILIKPLSGKTVDVPTFPFASIDSSYAFGLRPGYYRGYTKLTHSGSTPGYRALMTLLPTENIGVVTLLNGRDDHYLQRLPLQMYLLDRALGLEPWINKSTVCTWPEPWKTKPNVPQFRPTVDTNASLQLDSKLYEGEYHNDAYGYMDIHYNDTIHSLVMSYGFGTWRLLIWPDPEESRERFYAMGILPIGPFDVKPIYFVKHPRQDDVIVGVNASAFEPRTPPVFCKAHYKTVCTEAIFDAQIYNVGQCQVKGCDLKPTGNHGRRVHDYSAFYVLIVFALMSQKTLIDYLTNQIILHMRF